MKSTLIDSNVLVDLFDDESEWKGWSDAMITKCRDQGPIVINPIILAEVSAGFDSYEAVNQRLPEEFVVREPLPWEAAFLAARAFVIYAHAAVAGHTLLTRDARRYRHYFPKLRIIAP